MTDMIADVGEGRFCISVDAVIIHDGKVLLIKRNTPPFVGDWGNAGGLVHMDELLVDAVKREAKEEANVDVEIVKLVGVYDSLGRDPSKRSISVAFLCTAKGEPKPDGNETTDVQWFSLDSLPALAFDHEKIIRDASALSP